MKTRLIMVFFGAVIVSIVIFHGLSQFDIPRSIITKRTFDEVVQECARICESIGQAEADSEEWENRVFHYCATGMQLHVTDDVRNSVNGKLYSGVYSGHQPICIDSINCVNVAPFACQAGNRTIGIDNCLQVLCKSAFQRSPSYVDEVLAVIPEIIKGSCDLDHSTNPNLTGPSWWELNFKHLDCSAFAQNHSKWTAYRGSDSRIANSSSQAI